MRGRHLLEGLGHDPLARGQDLQPGWERLDGDKSIPDTSDKLCPSWDSVARRSRGRDSLSRANDSKTYALISALCGQGQYPKSWYLARGVLASENCEHERYVR